MLWITSTPAMWDAPSFAPVPSRLGSRKKFFFRVNKEYAHTLIFSSNSGINVTSIFLSLLHSVVSLPIDKAFPAFYQPAG